MTVVFHFFLPTHSDGNFRQKVIHAAQRLQLAEPVQRLFFFELVNNFVTEFSVSNCVNTL
jgi:hypothetical protein